MNAIQNNEKLQNVFDLEIDISVLLAFQTILMKMRNCERKLDSENNTPSHRLSAMDVLIQKIQNVGIRAKEVLPLSLFQDSCLQAKIKPRDYPAETLGFIHSELMQGKKRTELLCEYKRVNRNLDTDIFRMLNKDLLGTYEDLLKLCRYEEMAKKTAVFERFRVKMSRNRNERNTLEECQRVLRSNIDFIVFRMNMMRVKNDTVLTKWYTYRLAHQFLKVCLESAFCGEEISVQETRKSLWHSFMDIDKKLANMDAWYLGKNEFEESIQGFASRGIDFAWEYMKDLTSHNRMEFFIHSIKGDSLKKAIEKHDEEYNQVYLLIAEQGVLLWDVLIHQKDLVQDKDAQEALKWILSLIEVEELLIRAGDRLVVEQCETLGFEPTEQIENDFLIKEVLNTGMTMNGKILRKASVIVYRYMEVEEEVNG